MNIDATEMIAAVAAMMVMAFAAPAAVWADDDAWPPSPGVAVTGTAALFHSVPCGCTDRSVTAAGVSGRLHFGQWGAIEAETNRGLMVLGGNFPATFWSAGGRLAILPQTGRWWENLSVRTGYLRWSTMGMRVPSSGGVTGALNWSVNVLPHLYLEMELMGARVFEHMPHWQYGGRLGVATRF